ncbi:hypothetical protein PsorP6_009320 [Peronosclerospora sorghi]|uniref:Uncharacterized protein n=1 Tax=Peronosclerospora sorghi TaxID=230839 RepID=A0ACC0W0B9_9STRA|nr:hypothetical protein PsorP6_009320 [Peronosclerospora sorghi]
MRNVHGESTFPSSESPPVGRRISNRCTHWKLAIVSRLNSSGSDGLTMDGSWWWDVAFLERNEIQAIVALDTSNLAGKPLDILVIDILDMEDEILLPHLDECLQFLNRYLAREKAVLVHRVYGL